MINKINKGKEFEVFKLYCNKLIRAFRNCKEIPLWLRPICLTVNSLTSSNYYGKVNLENEEIAFFINDTKLNPDDIAKFMITIDDMIFLDNWYRKKCKSYKKYIFDIKNKLEIPNNFVKITEKYKCIKRKYLEASNNIRINCNFIFQNRIHWKMRVESEYDDKKKILNPTGVSIYRRCIAGWIK